MIRNSAKAILKSLSGDRLPKLCMASLQLLEIEYGFLGNSAVGSRVKYKFAHVRMWVE